MPCSDCRIAESSTDGIEPSLAVIGGVTPSEEQRVKIFEPEDKLADGGMLIRMMYSAAIHASYCCSQC